MIIFFLQVILLSTGDSKGLVDLDVEIDKCDKKLRLAQMSLQKIQKMEPQPDYEETAPANAKLANEDRVRTQLECQYVTPHNISFAEENPRGRYREPRTFKGDVC